MKPMDRTWFLRASKGYGRSIVLAAAMAAVVVVSGMPHAPLRILNVLDVVNTAQAATIPTPVPVDQQPLALRQPIPPDITLMLDDSGSMVWDVMPDYSYLGATPGSPTASELTSSDVNGLYYNPNVGYATPVKADGTLYPPATFTAAWVDGINYPTSATVNLSNYDGSMDTSQPYTGSSNIGYTKSFTVTTSGSEYPPTCPSGYLLAAGVCQKQDYIAYCPRRTLLQTSGTYTGKCKSGTGRRTRYVYPCGGTDTYVSLNSSKTGDVCSPNPPQTTTPKCKAGDSLDGSTGLCIPAGGTTKNVSFFTYTVKNAGGTFTSYYVGLSGTCALAVAAGDMPAANCDESAATQQNVANWFSYYHTRILMAKSSLMVAFSQINPSFRIGFGSIDGNNMSGLPSSAYSYNDVYNGQTNYIAQDTPFDTNCAANPSTCTPGASGTQRASFWSWIAGESAGGGTPLRQALDQVGQYYQTSQPWVTMSTDPGYGLSGQPTAIACRQAYTVLTTDGFWNDDFSGPGNADGTAGQQINGPNGQTYTYSPVQPYSDGYSNTLADVAMKYWKTDLQPSIDNNVPPSTDDPAFWQHMVTFTIGLGFTPTGISPSGTTIPQISNWAAGGTPVSGFAWPRPAANSLYNIADLAHAGINGHGGFFSATNPQIFVNGLLTALTRAADRVGTGASLAANSTQLQTGTAVFQANYYTGTWKGDLKSLAVDPNTGAIATTPTWSAEKQLQTAVCQPDSSTPGAIVCTNRNIQTFNPASGKFPMFADSGSGASATPPALSSAQLTALGASAQAQASMVSYLRGDTAQEQKNGGTMRNRDWRLGDIVDSQPVYEGPPNVNEFVNQNFPGYLYDPSNASASSPFLAWAAGSSASGTFTPSPASSRRGVVWVAGNDGMVHEFDATTGNELYAYLPGALMINSTDPVTGLSEPLANMADPNYGNTTTVPHQFYNDGEVTVADAYVQLPQDAAPAWHTILVGTTGRGPARAIYALDVTDPLNVTPLWERYANDTSSLDNNSSYIGQMVGKPVIAQTGDYSTSPEWSVLVGNGYNSTNGTAALLQLDLGTGRIYVHATDSATSNGLAAPVAWQDYPTSGIADYAYAGDLLGRVWSFPLVNVATATSGGTTTTTNTPTPNAAGTQLFTATDSKGNAQPITAGMWAGEDPQDQSVWLFFGTGKYLTEPDVDDQSVQSWYGIQAQSKPGTGPLSAYSRSSSSMVQRAITAELPGTTNPFRLPVRAVTMPSPTTDPYSTNDMKNKRGWYIDLVSPGPVAQGERMVSPNQFQGNLLVGITRIPKPIAEVSDPCNPAGGGWIMAVNPFSGTDPVTNFFDTNNDGQVNGGDTISVGGQQVPAAGVGFTSLPNSPIFIGGDMLVSFDNGTTASLKTVASSGGYSRVSWQEVVTQ